MYMYLGDRALDTETTEPLGVVEANRRRLKVVEQMLRRYQSWGTILWGSLRSVWEKRYGFIRRDSMSAKSYSNVSLLSLCWDNGFSWFVTYSIVDTQTSTIRESELNTAITPHKVLKPCGNSFFLSATQLYTPKNARKHDKIAFWTLPKRVYCCLWVCERL